MVGFLPSVTWAAGIHEFSLEAQVSPDEAVFVLGKHEDLGAGDLLKAVMLAPQGEGKWGGKIRLPVETAGTYQYLKRKTGAEEFEDPENAVFLGKPQVMQEVKGDRKSEANKLEGQGKLETPKYLDSPWKDFPGRKIRVWLPPGYEGGKDHYPVVYFHDGQNVFDPGGPFGS